MNLRKIFRFKGVLFRKYKGFNCKGCVFGDTGFCEFNALLDPTRLPIVRCGGSWETENMIIKRYEL